MQSINYVGQNSLPIVQNSIPTNTFTIGNTSTNPQMNMMPSMPMPSDMINTSLQMPSEIDVSSAQTSNTVNNNLNQPNGTTTQPGAQNLTSNVLNPPNISTNPLQDRYGFINNDPYGLNNKSNQDVQLIASQGLNLFPESSAYYNPDKTSFQNPLAAFGIGGTNGTNQKTEGLSKILKTVIITLASLVLFKSLKGRKNKAISEALGGVTNTVSKKIIREVDEFQDFFTDIMNNISSLSTKTANNIKLNLSGRTIDETKDIIEKTRRIATEYSRLPGVRPKYVIYLKEGMESSQNDLINSIKRNDIGSLSDQIIQGIEEINLIAEKISPSTELQSNIIFMPIVRETFSTHNNAELFELAGNNLRTRIQTKIINILSK